MNLDFTNVTQVMSQILEVYRTREVYFTIAGKDVHVKMDDKAHKPEDTDSMSAQVVLQNGKQGKLYVTVEVKNVAEAVNHVAEAVKHADDVAQTVDKTLDS